MGLILGARDVHNTSFWDLRTGSAAPLLGRTSQIHLSWAWLWMFYDETYEIESSTETA
ncbi:hypothetical protein CC80DRAFT_493063 [Byssothecium circinans]|uniref:Uncharacterized protein n=1 Tax=Byssothecium circinans TaxID=147558 RepID=A0A6A5TT65_9PLEO|nr:hypothetical protein CC80DRAFT_493063 [Byssothecium circinans]